MLISPELPLGRPGLPETRTTRRLAPGLTHVQIRRGRPDPDVHYAVEDSEGGRRGRFEDRDEASRAAARWGGSVVHTGEDPAPIDGPWTVNVFDVDLDVFQGSVVSALAQDHNPGRETVSSMAGRLGALAAVNGGYFVERETQGTPGDPAGVSVVEGRLVSEALDGRTALVLGPEGASVASVESRLGVSASSDGARFEVSGVNRAPGLVQSGREHDVTLAREDELVLFTPDFGDQAPPCFEVALDASGTVTAQGIGVAIPEDGSVLAGIGAGADWLLAHASPGETLSLRQEVLADGEVLRLAPESFVVNGGPRLLHQGRVDIRDREEGFVDDSFGERRNGRTMAGVTADHHLLLVTVDGHQPAHSLGVTFFEGAQLMLSLGAVEAVNLDGGGSTTAVAGGELVNRPSDAEGERAVGDALLFLAAS